MADRASATNVGLPLRRYAPVLALAAPLLLVAALVLALSALGAEREVVASGPASGLVLQGERPRELALHGALDDGSSLRPGISCSLQTASDARVLTGFRTGTATVEGRELTAIGEVQGPWEAGDVVSCTGVDRLAALAGQGPGARLAMAGLAGAVGLGAAGLALVGFRLRRG